MSKYIIEDPELLKQWDYEKNEEFGLAPDFITIGSNRKVYWKCPICGYSYYARVSNKSYLKRGCPACSNQVVWPGHNDLVTTHPQIAAEWHPTKNKDKRPEQYTYGSGEKV